MFETASRIRRTIAATCINVVLLPLIWALPAFAIQFTRWGQNHFTQIPLAAGLLAVLAIAALSFAWFSSPQLAAWLQLLLSLVLVFGVAASGPPRPFAIVGIPSDLAVREVLLLGGTSIVLVVLAISPVWSWRNLRRG